MSHDADYAQKKMLMTKRRNWEMHQLTERVEQLNERVDTLHEALLEIRRNINGIKAHLHEQ